MEAGRADGSRHAAFESIAESIPHLAWTSDPSGAVDYVNERTVSYIGAPAPATYGWAWVAMVHPDDADRARRGWEHATAVVTPFELTYRLRRHDGEYRWHVCRALPVRSERGRVMKWLGTADQLDLDVPADDDGRLRLQVEQLHRLLDATPAPDLVGAGPSSADVGITDDAVLGQLRPREQEVLRLLAIGYTNSEIADVLGVSLRTIESARSRIRTSLGLRTRAEIVRFARRLGLSDVP
jgi:PAS domain S-box-containing protein